MRKDFIDDNISVLPGNSPQAYTADGTGIVIDRKGYLSAKVLLAIGAIGGEPSAASVKAVVYHGDAANLSDAAVFQPDGSNVETSSLSTADTNTSKYVDLTGAKRYIRLAFDTAFTGGTTPSIIIASAVVLGDRNAVWSA